MGEDEHAGVEDAEAVLLDTDVFSDLLRGGDRAAPWLPLVTGRYALVSFITAGELKAWAEIRNWGAAPAPSVGIASESREKRVELGVVDGARPAHNAESGPPEPGGRRAQRRMHFTLGARYVMN